MRVAGARHGDSAAGVLQAVARFVLNRFARRPLLHRRAEATALRDAPASQTLRKLVKDVTRWRYGQKAHLESSLEALKLWDEDAPPQLESVTELAVEGRYGLAMRFRTEGVPFERWQEKRELLGSFFDKGLEARLSQPASGEVLLELLPVQPA